MSKRRQTLAHVPISDKKAKTNDEPFDCDSTPVPDLTDKQLRQSLIKLGETPGPVMPSTRSLYERLLQKYRDTPPTPTQEPPKPEPKFVKPEPQVAKPTAQSTPARASRKGRQSVAIKVDSSPEELDIESLPEPPTPLRSPQMKTPKTKRTPMKSTTSANMNIGNMTNKQIRDLLVASGGTPGPVNDANRNLYVELLTQQQRGEGSKAVAARRLAKTPVMMSSTRIDDTRPIITGSGVDTEAEAEDSVDYTELEEDMDVIEPSLCVSYVKSPYKKTRRSICKIQFTNTDFVVLSSTRSPSTRPSHYHSLSNSGVQALVTQECSPIDLVNVAKAAEGSVKIFAGINISSIKEGRVAVSNALQCGVQAVVLGFANYECSDSAAIANSIKQIITGHLSASYFYHHNPNTKACPVRVSKHLLELKNGYQGIFISPEKEETCLLLESLAIKIYETDSTKILRSLAHGIDSFASYEGIVAMPVIRKIKEEYYEGNTSESCRLQLILCRLLRVLTKYSDLIPSLHMTIRYLGGDPGPLPVPLQPLGNEGLLLKELAALNVDKWN